MGRSAATQYRSGVTFARGLGAVGRFMIRAGMIILLFVVYQLWGTGIPPPQAQPDLARQFRADQAEAQTARDGTTDGTADTLPDESTPATLAPPTPGASDGLVAPEPGQAIGQITIPRIGADFYMVEGTDLKWLKDGPGHFTG